MMSPNVCCKEDYKSLAVLHFTVHDFCRRLRIPTICDFKLRRNRGSSFLHDILIIFLYLRLKNSKTAMSADVNLRVQGYVWTKGTWVLEQWVTLISNRITVFGKYIILFFNYLMLIDLYGMCKMFKTNSPTWVQCWLGEYFPYLTGF